MTQKTVTATQLDISSIITAIESALSIPSIGSVSSITISSTDLSVSGSPITTSGTITLNLNSNAITNAKLAQMPSNTIKGNNTGSIANALDLTPTQVTAMLNVFTSSAQGLVPLSGGGTTNFLRADGTFAPVSGASGGTVTSVAVSSANGAISVSGSPITSSGTINLTANTFTTSTAGVVPGSGGGIVNYLRADATWSPITAGSISTTLPAGAVPFSSGTVLTFAGTDAESNIVFSYDNTNNILYVGGVGNNGTFSGQNSTGAHTGATVVVKGGNAAANSGGQVQIAGGNSAGGNFAGGAIQITGGNAGGTAAGGQITIQGGPGVASGSAGGAVIVQGGTGSGTGNGGALTLGGGQKGASGTYGSLILQTAITTRLTIDATGTWLLAGTTPGTSGQVLTSAGSGAPPTWTSATASSATNIAGGIANEIPFQSGPGATTFDAGLKYFTTGQLVLGTATNSASSISLTTSTNSTGPTFSILGANVTTGGGTGGPLTLQAGSASGATGTGGAASLFGGSGSTAGTGNGGNVTVQGGPGGSTSGNGGNAIIAGGTVTSGTPGSVTLQTTNSPRLTIDNNGAWKLAGTTPGTSGQVLTSTGSSTAPTWQNSSITFGNTTTVGDGTANATIRGFQSGTSVNLTIQGGVTSSGLGGNANLSGAASTGSNQAGGAATMTGGAATGTGTGGVVSIQAGNSGSTAGATGGDVDITGGTGLSSTSMGGNVVISSGSAASGGTGGAILFLSGASGFTATERLRILANGAWSVGSSGSATGTSGQVLTSNGSAAAPTWQAAGGGGSVSSVAVSSANGAISVTGSPITSSGTISLTANTFTTSTAGVVPGSGGGTTKFIRADGNWAVPPSGTIVSKPSSTSRTGASLTDDPDLIISGIGNGLHIFEAFLIVTCGGAPATFNITVNYTSGSTVGQFNYAFTKSNSSTASTTNTATTGGGIGSLAQTSMATSTLYNVLITGAFNPATIGGNISIQWASDGTNSITVNAGSWVRFT